MARTAKSGRTSTGAAGFEGYLAAAEAELHGYTGLGNTPVPPQWRRRLRGYQAAGVDVRLAVTRLLDESGFFE